ncbi:hypothetical protein DFP93_102292 [Aneurinibacillus soli]|uniref:Uncharacterized protein n=1 Tax=Aneurinibacillus soli TaxID=1500254 RepID=A0A0U5B761_9BACL|nr:hypothetical protein DFP93_102292 [Aneurinibacillus soli]BAU27462.1 hypothetical protein CB4_01636 [Aneurinibacillus soli]
MRFRCEIDAIRIESASVFIAKTVVLIKSDDFS